MAVTRKSSTPKQPSQAKALSAIADAITSLAATVETHEWAFFGRWDKERNMEVPGMVQKVDIVNEKIDRLEGYVKKYMKWGVGAAVLLSSIGAAHSFGVPTTALGQAVYGIYNAAVQHPTIIP